MTKKIIGITGGIGSGKTTVCRILEDMGFPVYYSDVRAKEIVYLPEVKKKITDLLDARAYNSDGNYDTKFVAQKIFSQDGLRLQLNAIIHPAVIKDYENWLQGQSSALTFKETALLFELNLDKNCDKTVLVTADDDIRIKRVMQRDQKSDAEIQNIINKQMPNSEKMKRADFVIYNNSDMGNLKSQTLHILKILSVS